MSNFSDCPDDEVDLDYAMLDALRGDDDGDGPLDHPCPLCGPDRADAQEITDRFGLQLLTPPRGRGWWADWNTACFVFVHPGTDVRWLPEQMQSNKQREDQRCIIDQN